MKIIDVNAAFGVWPIQPFTHTTLEKLDAAFERNGVVEAWTSSVESILFPDPDVHDLALFRQISLWPRLRPVKTVNPLLANWRECCLGANETYGLAALKLFPNYHGYPLNHVDMIKLAEFAAEQGLPILVAVRVNDERNQPVCLQVPRVGTDALLELAVTVPQATFVALGCYQPDLIALGAVSNIYAEISFLDEEDALFTAAQNFPAERLLYGSHAPFLYPESATLKLAVTQVSDEVAEAVACGNARKLAGPESQPGNHGYKLNGHATLATALKAP